MLRVLFLGKQIESEDFLKKFLGGFATASLLFSAFVFTMPADAAGTSIASQIAKLTAQVGALIKKVGSGTDTSLVKSLLPKAEQAVYQITCGNSVGSGFGISLNLRDDTKSQGYSGAIITNHHVIQNCTNMSNTVKVSQKGRNLGGVVWSWDVENDLALLLTIGNVKVLEPALVEPSRGDFVMALGSPFGLEGSVASGIISNFDNDTIITDAAVDTGNSGGPLINSKGEFVGINAWGWEGSKGNTHAIKPGVLCREVIVCGVDADLLQWSK